MPHGTVDARSATAIQLGVSIAFTDPADFVPFAVAAEHNGFDVVTLPDHLIYPPALSVPYPYTPDGVPRFTPDDPFVDPRLAAVAMVTATKTLWFYISVYVLPARDPFHVAKLLSSVAALTGNRIALGAGMGWMPEEFAAGGQQFEQPSSAADAPTMPIPIYVGGFSKPALRRAVQNDGWIADLHSLAELHALIGGEVRTLRAASERAAEPFRILSFGCGDAFDVDGYRAMRDMGVDVA